LYQEIASREDEIEDIRSQLLKKEAECAQLVSRNRSLESQVRGLKSERDRLLEVSQDLKVQINQSEKKQMASTVNT